MRRPKPNPQTPVLACLEKHLEILKVPPPTQLDLEVQMRFSELSLKLAPIGILFKLLSTINQAEIPLHLALERRAFLDLDGTSRDKKQPLNLNLVTVPYS